MRYLVISDIHANLEAYETVMAAAASLTGTEEMGSAGSGAAKDALGAAVTDALGTAGSGAVTGMRPVSGVAGSSASA